MKNKTARRGRQNGGFVSSMLRKIRQREGSKRALSRLKTSILEMDADDEEINEDVKTLLLDRIKSCQSFGTINKTACFDNVVHEIQRQKNKNLISPRGLLALNDIEGINMLSSDEIELGEKDVKQQKLKTREKHAAEFERLKKLNEKEAQEEAAREAAKQAEEKKNNQDAQRIATEQQENRLRIQKEKEEQEMQFQHEKEKLEADEAKLLEIQKQQFEKDEIDIRNKEGQQTEKQGMAASKLNTTFRKFLERKHAKTQRANYEKEKKDALQRQVNQEAAQRKIEESNKLLQEKITQSDESDDKLSKPLETKVEEREEEEEVEEKA